MNLSLKHCTFGIRPQEPNKLPPWVINFILKNKMNLRWIDNNMWGDYSYGDGLKFNFNFFGTQWLLTYLQCDNSMGVSNKDFIPFKDEFKTEVGGLSFTCNVYEILDTVIPLYKVINLNSVDLVDKEVTDAVFEFMNKSRMPGFAEVVESGGLNSISYWDMFATPDMHEQGVKNFICVNVFRTFITYVNQEAFMFAYNLAANRLIIGKGDFVVDKPTHLPSDDIVESGTSGEQN